MVVEGEEGGEEEAAASAAPPSAPSAPPAPPAPTPSTPTPAAIADAEALVDVDGDFGAKMATVTRRVKALLTADPAARVVVFSTWAEVLNVVDAALALNGVRALKPKTRRDVGAAAAAFQAAGAAGAAGTLSSSSPRVLLLRVAHGGAGLTLTGASHVVLVEPLLDPAAERQAVARVDRLGQTRPTVVHRFCVAGTVEEAVAARAAARREAAGAAAEGGGGRVRAAHETLTVGDVAALLGL
jgi:E3 ubiquitin-protein ligase SHPRH